MMRKTSLAAVVLSFVAAGAVGCSGGEKSLGTDNPAGATMGLADYAATWDGYVEAYEFPSGSDRIRLVLDEDGEGTVMFGDGDPLPAATELDAVYPPQLAGAEFGKALDGLPFEQIAYAAHDSRLEDARLRTDLHLEDAFADWCALQTPVRDEVNAGRYSCVPNWGYKGDETSQCTLLGPDEEELVVPCAKIELCMTECSCTETSCGVAEDGAGVQLDAALDDDGQTLDGTILLGSTPRAIRLTRQ